MARAFAEFHRLPLHPLLTRTRDTPPQSTLDRSARQRNVAGAFAADAAARGATVWLIDDVLTTGATLQAAISALQEAGASHIIPLALAH